MRASDNKRCGAGNAKAGNAWLKWAFSEAAVLCAQTDERLGACLNRLASKLGKAKAYSALAHKLGRAFYHMLRSKQVFDVTALKRVFNWCADEGVLPSNPIKRVKKAPPTCRERVLTPQERGKILAAIRDRPFREYVFALLETGCRPGEARAVTAAHVNLDVGAWVFPPKEHKTGKKTGKPRVVYLSPAMVELTQRLMGEHPEGPLFRSFRGGKPYTRQAVRCRFRRLRARFPELANVVSYTLRHTFATDALAQSVPIATVAELMGHSSTAMISRHYGHLAQRDAHLRDAARRLSRGECA